VTASQDGLDTEDRAAGREALGEALAAIIADPALDDPMRGELMILPNHTLIAERIERSDPGAIHAEREALKTWLGRKLESELAAMHERASMVPFSHSSEARGARKLKAQALVYLAAANPDLAVQMAAAQYDAADNMTDRQAALMVLAGLDAPEREAKLADFYERYRGNALVVDKWFTAQALSLHPDVFAQAQALAKHPDFTLRNPNRVRSLYMAFAANPHGFHRADGEGYKWIADLILALDPANPQTAARFVSPLGRWRRLEEGRAALMRGELERIAKAEKLSRDTYEQVSRSLG
jgi:aminopeptidase N